MKFDDIRGIVEGVPYLGIDEGWELYHFVLNHRPERCLELGHAHGVSSLYIAAGLDEIGGGHLDTVDLLGSANRQPNIEALLERAGLASYVSVYREKNSYTWFLKKQIERQTKNGTCTPCYDFCFVDGPKNWTIDGLSFFLVDKLMREDGWILFDDYKWTHGKHPEREQTDGITIRSLSDEEIAEPHIEAIFRLLVMQHPGYGNFEVQDDWWAWAQKRAGASKDLKKTRMAYHLRKGAG